MSNPYQQQYKQPKAYHSQPYNTRAQRGFNQNTQSQQSIENMDLGSEQSYNNFSFTQNDTINTQYTPNTNPLYDSSISKTQNTSPQTYYNATMDNSKYASTLQQIEQLQSTLRTPNVQQNLSSRFDSASTPQNDKILQNLLELCQSLVSQQNKHTEQFQQIDKNANTLVKDIQYQILQNEQKIPSIDYLRGLFKDYSTMIGDEIVALIDNKQSSLQVEMQKTENISNNAINVLQKDIDGISKFQEQFNAQCTNFNKSISELHQNYSFLNQYINQQTPQQQRESKLTTKVYEQVLTRMSTRIQELFDQHKGLSKDQMYQDVQLYLNKELQKLQTDVSQSIKKQQTYEYNVLKSDLYMHKNEQQIANQQQQNIGNNLNEQIQLISQQMAQVQLQNAQKQQFQSYSPQFNKYDDMINKQQLEINLLKQQLKSVATQNFEQNVQQPSSTTKSDISLNHYTNDGASAPQKQRVYSQANNSQFTGQYDPQMYQPNSQSINNSLYDNQGQNKQFQQYYTQPYTYYQPSTQQQSFGQQYYVNQPIKIDKFKGTTSAHLWLSKLERQLQLHPEINEHQATLIALDNLIDQPYRWAASHEQYYTVHYDQFNSLNNVYSFKSFKQLFLNRFVKSLEDFQGQLLLERQQQGQSYDEFARKLNYIANQGHVQESYLKLIFLNNIYRQDVALQLSHLRDDPKFDLLDLAREAHLIEQKLNYIKRQDRSRVNTDNRQQQVYRGAFQGNRANPRAPMAQNRQNQGNNRAKQTPKGIQTIEENNVIALDEQALQNNVNVGNNMQANIDQNDALQFVENDIIQDFDQQVYDEQYDNTQYDYTHFDANYNVSNDNANSNNVNTSNQMGTLQVVEQPKEQSTSIYEKANKYRFDVENYFNHKRTDVLLHELFQNSQLYGKQLKNYVDKFNIGGTNDFVKQDAFNTAPMVGNLSQNAIVVDANPTTTLWYIQLRIQRSHTLALVDCGAVQSVISQKYFQSLRTSFQIKECTKEYRLANGELFVPIGQVTIPLTVNDINVNTTCLLAQNVSYDVLIGLDFIKAINAGTLFNKFFVYINPHSNLLQSTLLLSQTGNKIQQSNQENGVMSLIEVRSKEMENTNEISNISQGNKYILNQGNVLGNRFNSKDRFGKGMPKGASLTRREKFHNKLPPHLASQVKEIQNKKLSTVVKSQFLFPSFPLKSKYQLILIDPPIRYESTTQLKPPYSVLSMDQLKSLPINQVSDDMGCVLLQWASGISMDKVLDLSKSYGFKHYSIFNVWRKLDKNGQLYFSKTLNPTTTTPNYEFLVMSTKGNWKQVLKDKHIQVMQELEAKVSFHSKKPSEIYESIKTIFDVQKHKCLEVFATIDKHPYFDLYGNQVQNFFQPSLKVIPNDSFVNDAGEINVLQQSSKNISNENDKLKSFCDNLLKKSSLQETDKVKARKIIEKYREAFALNEFEVGEIQDMEFPIDLIPGAQPFAQHPYRLSDKEREVMKEQIENWERLGYIERRNTQWASPAFLVPKEGGKYRVCTDYRYLNVQTQQHHWPIPNMFDFFPYLVNKPYISKFDLKSSYQNLRIRKKDQHLTAFICFLGIFVCLRMLFGQKNSASYFQMAIENILKPLLHVCVLVYIDDIIVFSATFDQHQKDLEKVLQLLIKGNVKLHAEKSSLYLNEVEFLGHTIKDGKYFPRPKNHGILKNMHAPQSKTQVKSFLGLVGFYRKFVKDFAIIAQPLTNLLKNNTPFSWDNNHESAFQSLRAKIMELPALYLPNNQKTFFLSTDFCIDGLGAVLSQKDDQNHEYPIEFASRSLNVHERKYGSYEGELLGVVWALQKFRHLLINQQFVLYTDNKALSQVLQKGNPSMKIQRWLLVLNEFSFLVIHRDGKNNINADAISRLNPLFQNNDMVSTQFLCNVDEQSFEPIDLPDLPCRICKSKEAQDMLLCELCGRGYHKFCITNIPTDLPSDFYYCTSCYDRIQKQEIKDITLDFPVLNFVKSKVIPSDVNERQRVIKRAKNLVYDQSKGRFLIKIKDEYKTIPTILERRQIIQQNHDNSSHPGTLKTCSLILQAYYWRNVVQWVKQHISKCALCIANKSQYQKQAEYIPVEKGNIPGEYWAIDLATNLPTSKDGYKHLLVIVDSFSKWVELIELKSKESLELTQKIHKNIVSTFGKPKAFRSDRGTEFKGNFDEFCHAVGIAHHRTHPNHPQGNGQAERLVGFSIELIRRTIHQRQWSLNEWPRCLPTVLYTLRFSNCIAKIPPFEVVFGHKPSLISPLEFAPKHVNLNITDKEVESYAKQLAISQKALFPKIKQQLENLDEDRKTKHESKAPQSLIPFYQNQMVFRNTGQRTTKLQLSSQGPYVFIEYKGPTGAIIQDPVTAKQYQVNKYDLVGVPKLTKDPMDLQPDVDSDEEVNIHQNLQNSTVNNANQNKSTRNKNYKRK